VAHRSWEKLRGFAADLFIPLARVNARSFLRWIVTLKPYLRTSFHEISLRPAVNRFTVFFASLNRAALPIEEELRRLRAENKRRQAERDILKKAAAFFAREAT
jgi:transposase-like protein